MGEFIAESASFRVKRLRIGLAVFLSPWSAPALIILMSVVTARGWPFHYELGLIVTISVLTSYMAVVILGLPFEFGTHHRRVRVVAVAVRPRRRTVGRRLQQAHQGGGNCGGKPLCQRAENSTKCLISRTNARETGPPSRNVSGNPETGINARFPRNSRSVTSRAVS
jgi:hypothetical protein